MCIGGNEDDRNRTPLAPNTAVGRAAGHHVDDVEDLSARITCVVATTGSAGAISGIVGSLSDTNPRASY
jgi:hypothetical protein